MAIDQNTTNLIVFAEQMATLLAKTIVDLKSVFAGDKTADAALADADANFQSIIDAKPPAP